MRTFQWTHFVDDLSGIDEGEWWNPEDCLTGQLRDLVISMAPRYFFMASAMKEQLQGTDITRALNGSGYRVKCMLQVKQAFADLNQADQDLLKTFLESCDCWDALQFAGGEKDRVIPLIVG